MDCLAKRPGSPTTSVAFEIDNGQLRRVAKRPRHVAQRFPRRTDSAHSDIGTGSASASGSASDAESDPTEPSIDPAAQKRAALLRERLTKLAHHHDHIVAAASAAEAARAAASASARDDMARALDDAERNRREWTMRRATLAADAVRHAKEVAKRANAMSAARTRRLQRLLDKKLRASQWRRMQLQALPRAAWMYAPEGPDALLNDLYRKHQAAARLQRWWREVTVTPVVADVRKLFVALRKPVGNTASAPASNVASPSATPAKPVKAASSSQVGKKKPAAGSVVVPSALRGALGLERLAAMPFAEAAAVLQKPLVIKITGRFLQRVKKTAVDPPDLGKTPTRVFLSVFMLLAHTNEIVEDPNGPLEQELLGTARTMHDALVHLAKHAAARTAKSAATVSRASLYTDLSAFLQAWFAYHTTFEAFKSRDTQGIVTNLVAHALELVRLLANVTGTSDVTDAEWRPSILAQVRVMQQRLAHVAGDAGVAQLQASLDREGLAHVLEDQLADVRSASPAEDSVLAPSSPSKRAAQLVVVDDAEAHRTQPRAESPVRVQPMPPTPPEHARGPSEDPRRRIRDIATNHALAHELVVNPEFQLRAPTETNPVARAVKLAAQRAFKDRIEHLASQGDLSFLIDLVGEVRGALVGMAQDAPALRAAIEGALDPDLLQQQWAHTREIDVQALLGTIVRLMLQIAAPARDAEIQALATKPVLGDVIVEIHDLLEKMQLDMANFHLHQLRPVLQAQAVEYEAKKFAERLALVEDPTAALARTDAWLGTAARDQLATCHARNPEGLPLTDATRPKFEEVYHDALVALLMSPSPIDLDSMPETLALDAQRLRDAQAALQALATAAALCMVARNAVPWFRHATVTLDMRAAPVAGTRNARPTTAPRAVPAAQALAARLLTVLGIDPDRGTPLAETTPATAQHLVDAVVDAVAQAGTLPGDQRALLASLVAKTAAPARNDAVSSMVARRVAASVRHRLALDAAAADGRARMRRDSLVANGLDVVEAPLNAVARRLAAVARHNKQVYAAWYDAILARVLADA
ncbi:hypothetical protein AMAG_12219 [Allomyces macrogynus ATCC 38327]|uniref:T-complex protein 11 n=1 Tax=Allomyces macrogynus (strain ATCC 38327) TaxID=578462 RepID=A0A0L0SXU9_ALLM3|nr:hypothetical protein, variant [Allomyces macrogynus ATCC 38327]KNE67149.1 hypothetical protein AMAG_12219 [Allomyces macrogynus ATCC 38327]|eukprot:KNE67148.1 hypothetical protein, variant [Allomyces macrogynus ATCC 38327]